MSAPVRGTLSSSSTPGGTSTVYRAKLSFPEIEASFELTAEHAAILSQNEARIRVCDQLAKSMSALVWNKAYEALKKASEERPAIVREWLV